MNNASSFTACKYLISSLASLKRLGMAASLLALSSCVVVRIPVSPEIANSPKPGEGYVVATVESKGFTRDGKPVPAMGRVGVGAKGVGSNKSVIVSMMPMVATKEPRGFGYFLGLPFAASRPSNVIAVPVPEGDYHISGWSVTDRAVSADVIFGSRLPMNVPFQVRSGEATYIGRINAVTVYGKNILGMQVPGEALVIISDEYDKDLSRIASTYPKIKRATIRKSNVPELYRTDMKRIAETPSKFFGLFE